MELTNLDFGILTCIKNGRVPWKKKIHTTLTSEPRYSTFGGDTSLQTVGKHVDDMLDEDLLRTAIIEPDEDVNRAYMVGFQLTEKGENLLQQKRDEILREQVSQSSRSIICNPSEEVDVEKAVIVGLIKDEFDIDEEIMPLIDDCSSKDLLLMLGLYYFRSNVKELFDDQSIGDIQGIVINTPKLLDTLQQNDVIDTMLVDIKEYAGTRLPQKNVIADPAPEQDS